MEPDLREGEDLQHFLERQARQMQERASELQEAFSSAGATVTSRDGSVTVTLAPNGGLRSLQLGKRACELGPARLTSVIMETVGQAQRETARAVASSLESVIGGGQTLDMVRSFLPAEPGESEVDLEKFAAEPDEDPRPKPPVPPPPSARPAPRRRPEREEDDEVNPW
ncbi:YbaB/EbfC family nucleoid-associated protein [Saccharomonospora xinjiangensis]|uniref:YbaB/EbfC family nucleoid-associated protein n=1 Tax=Saccharomonospora xinjiangensis TaxID=75294 RepID=UPI00106FE931|nr:YbaB/EbfC family nucleoid-associated protein [Saccharomonospora xinjiangensis]QBQ61554.1 hypothetical protein EYD13_16045 [Saccharomonospora xinjiangensis]